MTTDPHRRPTRLAATGLFALALFGCASGAAPPPVAETPMDASTVLSRIHEIAQHRPFDPAAIGAATGMSMSEATTESNPYYTIHRSEAAGPVFAAVEVRAPTAKSAGKGGLVIAKVAEPCVALTDVGDRFGAPDPGPPSIPRPGMPKDSPRYTTYKQPWGEVRLGFSPTTGCLVMAVLDAT